MTACEHPQEPRLRRIGDDRARAAALDGYGILDTAPEAAFEDIARLAAEICETTISAVSLLCPARQWFKARVGLGATETPIAQSFCAHAVARGGPEIFEVRDATRDPRFVANPLVTGEPHIRFYAGAPLIDPHGVGLGALCVIDPVPRPRGLSPMQSRALRTLADQIIALLELRRTIAQRDDHAARRVTTAEELRWLATHDPLTGLANRTLFQTQLHDALARDGGTARSALLMLDLDHFKQINDRLGHGAGDGMLKSFADRLKSVVRSTDTVARLGGDEFAVILPGVGRPEEVERITTSIYARLSDPLVYDGRIVECRATIGVAIYPDHAADAAELTRNADMALYAAKAAGRGRAAVFGSAMLASNQRHTAMIERARTALAQGWITPFYQPKIDLATGAVAGFEALLRIVEPGMPVAPPAAILAAFEDTDLAMRLGETMIARVAEDMRCWGDAGLAFGRVAVNASAAEFRDDGFADRLLDALRAAGVPSDQLELEVTETVFLDRQAQTVAQTLRRLSGAGVRIALDDFGTGYASLSHLQQFPVDVLKIDQSFVRGLHEGSGSSAIVHALLNLGANLGIQTVAEGIETLAQANYLRDNGCRLGQGYLYDRALPAAQVPDAVRRRVVLASCDNVTRLHPGPRAPALDERRSIVNADLLAALL